MSLRLLTLYNELSVKNFEKNDDDDLYDKCSRKFSTIMMLIFSFILSTAQLVGEPIRCWCPNEFTLARCDYATTYCYINSQYIPITNGTQIPSKDQLLSHKIIYYQWVIYMFFLQALVFYIPCLVWKWLNTKTGLAIRNYIEELRKDKSVNTVNPAVKYVSAHIISSLTLRRNYVHRGLIKKLVCRVCKFCGLSFFKTSFLFFCHIFVKILYLSFTVLQIVTLNYWLRDHHHSPNTAVFFGFYDWKLKDRFPRMTLCKFDVFVQMNDRQIHWLQCTLPMNLFLEKIYVGIYIWLWILVLITLIGVFHMIFIILPIYRKRFIKKRLLNQKTSDVENLYKFLGLDGILTLCLLSSNTNDVNVNAIVNEFINSNQEEKK